MNRFAAILMLTLAAAAAWFAFFRPPSAPLGRDAAAGTDSAVAEIGRQNGRIHDLESRFTVLQAALERTQAGVARSAWQLRQLQQQVDALGSNGSGAPAQDTALNPAQTNQPGQKAKRSWGPEQAVGPPDTPGAGDLPTAWASLEPDAGPEWLLLEYSSPVFVKEVRIRESFNPGAISKVTAVYNASESVLWEGVEPASSAPSDFSVPVTGNVLAQALVVCLDTARVAGWNEIDAVELVGQDGSRQWAVQASASSTYADRNPSGPPDSPTQELPIR